MRRPALYSSSRSGRSEPDNPSVEEAAPAAPTKVSWWRRIHLSSTRLLWAAVVVLAASLAFTVNHGLRNTQRKLTQDDINAAVMKTLEIVNDSITLSFYDNGVVDGDVISVFVNGENVINQDATGLKKAWKGAIPCLLN